MLFDRLRSQTNPRFVCMTQFLILFGINRMYFTSTLGLWPFLKSGLTDLLICLSSCRALVPVWYAPTSRTTWWGERTGRSVITQDRSDFTTLLFHTQHYITKYSYPVTIESISFRNYLFFVSDYIFFKTKIDSLHFAICLWQFFFSILITGFTARWHSKVCRIRTGNAPSCSGKFKYNVPVLQFPVFVLCISQIFEEIHIKDNISFQLVKNINKTVSLR